MIFCVNILFVGLFYLFGIVFIDYVRGEKLDVKVGSCWFDD